MRYFIILTLAFQFLFISKAYTYTCQTDEFCLDELHNDFLNTSSNKSIDKYCKVSLKNAGSCCSDPLACSNNKFRQVTQTIREGNWSFVTDKQAAPISCQAHQLSVFSNILGNLQVEFCHLAEALCQEECQVKLNEFKEAFKSCFRIPSNSSLDDILKKNPTENKECYQKMTQVAEKYKAQSLEGKAELKEQIKAEDIVKCKEVKKEKTQASLMKLTQSTCQIAKTKQEQIREQERKKQAEEKAKSEEKARAEKEKLRLAEEKARLEEEQAKAEAERKKAQEKAQKKEAEILESQSQSNKANLETKTTKNQALNTQTLGQEAQNKLRTGNTSKKSGFQSHQAPETIHLAQASNNSGCPSFMPKIKSIKVFQSVESPQIEPLDQQEFQTDLNNPKFSSYDLIPRKPAGVLVEIEGLHPYNIPSFHLSLKKRQARKFINKCFHDPLNGKIMKEGTQTDCSFSLSQGFREYKFIPFPSILRGNKTKTYSLTLTYKHRKDCRLTRNFDLNITQQTPTLKLAFSGISDKKCKKHYSFSHSNKFQMVQDFINSQEVSELIEPMFPIRQLKTFFTKNKNKKTIFTIGVCKNNPATSTKDILLDIKNLELQRRKQKKKTHKIIAIVPRDYFSYHLKDLVGINGLVMHPTWKHQSSRKSILLGGSWNVTLIHEDTLNHGVILHELGHLFGQGKEFYEKYDNKWNPLPTKDQSKCRRFNGSPKELCHKYKVKLGLKAIKQKDQITWQFVQDKYSIMSNEALNDIWMDRETFQKNLKVLSRGQGGVGQNNKEFMDNEYKKQIVFSGFYDLKRKEIILPDIEILKTNISNPSFPKNKGLSFLKFQLKYKDKKFKEIYYPLIESTIRILYNNGRHTNLPVSLAPLMISFDINKSYENKSFVLDVINPQSQKLILSRSFSIKPESKNKNKTEEEKNEKERTNEKKGGLSS